MLEKDLFKGYEIKSWEFGPRIYKILAASTILTLLPLFLLGQTNLLSASACSSPFVNRVCQVLDTVYAGANILAKDAGYVDRDYQDLQLQEENEIVWLDETNLEPKLEYPEGYFQIANRDELAALAALDPNNPNAGFANIPQAIPPVNNNPIAPPVSRVNPPLARNRGGSKSPVFPERKDKILDGDISDDPIGDSIAGKDEKDPEKTGKKPETGKKPDDKTTAATPKRDNPLDKETARESEPLKDYEINRKPLYDFADIVQERVEAKQVDLAQMFRVTMTGFVTKEGLLDEKLSQWGQSAGNEQMVELAKLGILKLGSSGWLKYLSDKDVFRLNMVFEQNDTQMLSRVVSDLGDPNKAKSTASALNALISAAKIAHKNNIKRLKDDEYLLLESAKVTSEGNLMVVNFVMEKPLAQQIIAVRLAEYKQKKEEEARKKATSGKPSGMVTKQSASRLAG